MLQNINIKVSVPSLGFFSIKLLLFFLSFYFILAILQPKKFCWMTMTTELETLENTLCSFVEKLIFYCTHKTATQTIFYEKDNLFTEFRVQKIYNLYHRYNLLQY